MANIMFCHFFSRTDSLIVTSLKYNIKYSSLNVKHWIIPFLIKFDCLINIDEWSCNWQIYLDSSITLPSAMDVLISWIMAANCSRHKPVRIKNFVLSTTFAFKKSVVAGSRYLIWHVAKRFYARVWFFLFLELVFFTNLVLCYALCAGCSLLIWKQCFA